MEDQTRDIPQNSPAQGQAPDDRIAPDAPTINDSMAAVGKDELQQGVA